MVADVQRMQEEVKRHFAHQKAENSPRPGGPRFRLPRRTEESQQGARSA